MNVARVWDAYLTESDKASLAASPQRAEQQWGIGDKPAILLVDLYRGVFGDGPKSILDGIADWPATCGMFAWDAVPHIQRLMSTARELGIPLIHVTGLNDPQVGHWPRGRKPGPQGPPKEVSMAVRFEIIPECAPIAGETIIYKTGASPFWGTPLLSYLNEQRIDSLIIAGESTSGCVRASVVDARSNRFPVTVVEECVFDRHEAAHAMNLFDMHEKYADVLPLERVLELIK